MDTSPALSNIYPSWLSAGRGIFASQARPK
nr:MAG TPA: hypothetical protein [Caudoviricetes sp.]